MKFITALLTTLMLIPSLGLAQNMVALPVDEAAKDPSFLAYRTAFLKAVEAQDTEAVLQFTDPDIHLSFGGLSGRDAMRIFLNLSADDVSDDYKSQAAQMRQDYWDALEAVLRLGGRFDGGAFIAPYTWTAKYPEDVDAYDIHFVTGSNVLMRAAGNADASVIERLSYNIVFNDNWQEGADYQTIRLPDGRNGYLSSKYLRALIDYRATFVKSGDVWQMIMFIAGD